MTVFIIVSIIVIVGLGVAATLGRYGRTDLQLDPPTSSAGGWLPRERDALTPEDVDDVRFDVVVRGYRMDQVDALLARLRAELDRRDRQVFEGEAPTAPTYPFSPRPGRGSQ